MRLLLRLRGPEPFAAMRPAAPRFAAISVVVFAVSVGVFGFAADEAATRRPPLRPTANAPLPKLALKRLGGVDYVELDDVTARLGLKRSTDATRKIVLSDKTTRLVLEAESRDVSVNGLRVLFGQKVIASKGELYVSQSDFERCLLPRVRPSLIVPLLPAPKVIAIDAGHGGTDNGMENPKLGLQEKTLALNVALRLKKLLETADYKVVMTRSDDQVFSADKKKDLPHRTQVANRAGADLFVSIHFNSLYPDTKTNGTEVYVYSRQGQRSDQSWGLGEEDDTKREPFPVNRYDAWSSLFAHCLQREMLGQLKTFDRGQKTKHLLMLQDLNCPAVLVEAVFLSNDNEARLAATPAYQQQIAQAIADGIRVYANTVDSFQPRLQPATPTPSGGSNSR